MLEFLNRIKDEHKYDDETLKTIGEEEQIDVMKRDSEIKILIGCTEEEKPEVYKTHNETQYIKGVLIYRKIPF